MKQINWRRYRFHANDDDWRPVEFPPPGPYWCAGFGDGFSVIVAYMPADADLKQYWPDAENVEFTEESEIVYSDRFPKPDWLHLTTP